ncbi:MAG: tRNA (adenosine(37)-N6)-dimethylallyltransferase MiaA [Micrococcales bacterium]|nr:tRNA (adenosine(37)-N6)-dimethylallyltransferase MiaA [Micrococcales bacterium]
MGVVVAVVGPTATGKSSLAVSLARALGGEVVNADAFQLYRGMDVGTAKVTDAERAGVPHHLLDVVEPDQVTSVARYRAQGRAVLADLDARGRRAVVVGGSGLYVRALLDPMSFPGTDPALRAALEERAEREGPGVLHDELALLDPAAAAGIDRRNARRLVRALEVHALTGQVPPRELTRYVYEVPAVQIGLELSRAALDAAISARVDAMWTAGLVEEVRRLREVGLSVTAARAVGYAQVLAMLDGRLDEASAREQTVVATRRLARKQMGWFGRDPRVRWLPADAGDLLDRALGLVARADAGQLDDPAAPTRRALP